MSPPGPDWKLRGRANFRSREADPVDARLAYREWVALARGIEAAGGHVVALPPAAELTGLPYCAEAGHPLPPEAGDPRPRFVLPRMHAPHRAAEANLWAAFAEELGFRVVLPKSGTWEAQGDVASFAGTTVLFWGGRTDRAGLDAVRPMFPDDALEIEIREPAFHGNVAVLPIESIGRLLICPELIVADGVGRLEERFGVERVLRISVEEAKCYATNALPIGKCLLAPTVAPRRVMSLLEELGMHIEELVMRELCEKAGGASRCLVCRVPSFIASSLRVPERASLGAITSGERA